MMTSMRQRVRQQATAVPISAIGLEIQTLILPFQKSPPPRRPPIDPQKRHRQLYSIVSVLYFRVSKI